MSKLVSWRFGYFKIYQHLLLGLSLGKQRELCCTPNIFCIYMYRETAGGFPKDILGNFVGNQYYKMNSGQSFCHQYFSFKKSARAYGLSSCPTALIFVSWINLSKFTFRIWGIGSPMLNFYKFDCRLWISMPVSDDENSKQQFIQ